MNKNNKTKLIGTGAILGTMAILGGALAIGKKIKNDKLEKFLERENYSTGKIRKFGTLYLDDEKQKTPSDFLDFKDIPVHIGQKIEIRDTNKSDENKLLWIEINDNNKKLLICDRNILKEVSWNDLNNQNLVFGKVVIIEGKKYILRLLTGYDEKKDIKYNEWDKYIVNIHNLLELPTTDEYDINNISNEENDDEIDGENNNLWNWYNFSSFTQNEDFKNKKLCIIRGLYSATYSNALDKEFKYETVGYRPVLELIE